MSDKLTSTSGIEDVIVKRRCRCFIKFEIHKTKDKIVIGNWKELTFSYVDNSEIKTSCCVPKTKKGPVAIFLAENSWQKLISNILIGHPKLFLQ